MYVESEYFEQLLYFKNLLIEYFGIEAVNKPEIIKDFFEFYRDDIRQFSPPTEEKLPDDAPAFPENGEHFK